MASIQPHTGTLGVRLAKHLLRRSSYRYTPTAIDNLAGMSVTNAVNSLFNPYILDMDEPLDFVSGQPFINSGENFSPPEGLEDFEKRRNVTAWWLREAEKNPGIQHRMTFFLHSVFVISTAAVTPYQYFDYLDLLSFYATGNYKILAKKITIDTAMLRYLNGDDNVRESPNENYAREFFELFTIGKGPQIGSGNYTNYTEADIVTAARVLTGWEKTWTRPLGGNEAYRDSDTGITRGRPNFLEHDLDDKTFTSAFNNTTILAAVDEADMFRELDDFVEMIFAQPETAKNICRKLYRYFVHHNITEEIELDIITPLSQTLIGDDYDLEPTIKQLLFSQHFYDQGDGDTTDDVIGGIIKSPMENWIQAATFFNIQVPDPVTEGRDHYLKWYWESVALVLHEGAGMTFFRPENVAGYPAYYQAPGYDKNWFGGSTLITRYKLPEILLRGRRVLAEGDSRAVPLDIVRFIQNSGVVSDPANGAEIVDNLIGYLFAETPLTARRDYLLNELFLDDLSLINWQFEWQAYENTGNADNVKIPLERLFTALISSQEFQNN